MNSEGYREPIPAEQLAGYIDHTILKPDATIDAVLQVCDEAIAHGFKAVCVNSCHVAHVVRRLEDTRIATCSVIGFPLGAMHPWAKAFEARTAVEHGASELDMVLNIGAFKSGDWAGVKTDIQAVRKAAGEGVLLKIIIETCLLNDPQKIEACRLAMESGADFIKTSTGFSTGGATVEDVALIRRIVENRLGVKASGGIDDWDTAQAMIQAGASRIGTSSGVAIMKAARLRESS